ncbi:hypothetical protein EV182_001512 [Spiromyces aspiralis]|uniref:Uncharacterized protein n=1 Tax=Spiromyces aspiralis TaxID=68401 RepID=A0ACC1HZ42_9FUNG|nr:hypothetical protein EV182_001512 [Spiromyces aspiralis]
MKFQQQLALKAIPSLSKYYLDYKLLKSTLYDTQSQIEGLEDKSQAPALIEANFKNRLFAELDKVNGFYTSRYDGYRKTYEDLKGRKKCKKLLNDIEILSDFGNVNFTACHKIVKKATKVLEKDMRSELLPKIEACAFTKSELRDKFMNEVFMLWHDNTLAVQDTLWSHRPSCRRVESIEDEVTSDIKTYSNLNLDSFFPGDVSRFWVVLAENALGLSLKVPVMVAKGAFPGPIVGITAALHGNEINGIPIIHRLFKDLDPNQLHGTVVAVPVANVPGFLTSQRGYNDGTDLNRVMPGKPNGTSPQVYAYNLMDRIVKHFEYLIDLHTASRGRINSLYVRANMLDSRTRRMAKLQNPQIIVHNTSPDGSLRGAAMERNIPAITLEIGDPSRFQKHFVDNALLGVTNILSHLHMIPAEAELPEYDPVVCTHSYWIFSRSGGILTVLPDVNTWVRKGEPIAHIHSVFGDLIETYYAPDDGVIVGKHVDPVCQSGNRILHLGIVEGQYLQHTDDGHL